jgi:DNA-binding transcriptional LysR family regulator
MELHQLECFITVVEFGSFRAASEKLNKAQSAVSIAIKTLESQLGFNLFDRSEYRPQLTMQGRSFLPQVKAFLQQNEYLKSYGHFLKQGYESRLTLGVSHIFPQCELIPVVHNFTLQFPFTEIVILPETLSADELLESEKVDLILGEVFNEKQLFEIKPLGYLRMIQVCSGAHPLAQFKNITPRAEFLKHRQVVLKSTVQESTRIAGVAPGQPQIGVQDFAMKKELLLRGVGWGSMPVHLIEAELKKKKLVPTSKIEIEVPLFLAWSKKRTLGPCAQFLISALSAKKMKI